MLSSINKFEKANYAMFDKITKYFVEAVYTGEKESPKKNIVATYLLPIVALLLSMSSLSVSYFSYSTNLEGLNVRVERDENSAIDIVRPAGDIYPAYEREDAALLAR